MFARPMKGRSLSSVKLDAVMLVHYGPVTKKLSFLNNKAARCVYNALGHRGFVPNYCQEGQHGPDFATT
jgi:hypothetical protein